MEVPQWHSPSNARPQLLHLKCMQSLGRPPVPGWRRESARLLHDTTAAYTILLLPHFADMLLSDRALLC